jgi:hypothetical protein
MTTTSPAERDRAIVKDVVRRAKGDPGYLDQLERDPVGTLAAAGMSGEGIVDYLVENTDDEDDVSGYIASFGGLVGNVKLPSVGGGIATSGGAAGTCYYTCVSTSCCVTKINNPGDFASNPGTYGGLGH